MSKSSRARLLAATSLVLLVIAATLAQSVDDSPDRSPITSSLLRLDSERNRLNSEGLQMDSPQFPLPERAASLRSLAGSLRSASEHLRSPWFRLDSAIVDPPPKPAPGDTFTIKFAFASDEVQPNPNDLRDLARRLVTSDGRTHETPFLDVTGHADRIGSNDDNRDLSARRALAVANILIGGGFRVRAWAYGETCPVVAPSKGPEGQDLPGARARNRRVVVSIGDDAGPEAAQRCARRAPTLIRLKP